MKYLPSEHEILLIFWREYKEKIKFWFVFIFLLKHSSLTVTNFRNIFLFDRKSFTTLNSFLPLRCILPWIQARGLAPKLFIFFKYKVKQITHYEVTIYWRKRPSLHLNHLCKMCVWKLLESMRERAPGIVSHSVAVEMIAMASRSSLWLAEQSEGCNISHLISVCWCFWKRKTALLNCLQTWVKVLNMLPAICWKLPLVSTWGGGTVEKTLPCFTLKLIQTLSAATFPAFLFMYAFGHFISFIFPCPAISFLSSILLPPSSFTSYHKKKCHNSCK